MAIAHVQRAGYAVDDSGWTSTKACTVSGITVGHSIFVLIGGGYGQTVTSVTDNAVGNTYAVDIAAYNVGNEIAAIASCLNVVAAPTVITVHFGGTEDDTQITVEEFSGLYADAAKDKTAVSTYDWIDALSVGPTATTTQADELIIAVWGVNLHSGSWTKAATYTDFGLLAGTTKELLSEYKIVSSTGAQTATGTLPSGGNYCIGSLATYKMGTAPAATNIKTVDGVAYASLKTVDGVALASLKNVDGLA